VKEFSVLILAGGNGVRFGGRKAFFKVGEKPMVQHVFERISKLSDEILISCKLDYAELLEMFPRAKVVQDKSDKNGALTGLISSLPEVRSKYVAIVTCDCPRIKPAVLSLLLENARGHDGGIPRWPNGYMEPLQAVYRTERLQEATRKAWGAERMKMADMLEILPDLFFVSTEEIKKVDPQLESFFNVNTPKDVDSF
jgi:molybdopterin-guanine dinucleotide biosynthesis protein A